jgi:predicted RND superfamily exporter protein
MIRFLNNLLKLRWPLVVALLAILPWSLQAAWQSWLSNSNNVADWIPHDEQLAQFVELFGSDELLMISWEGCTFEDDRIAAYAQTLAAPAPDGPAYFREVITGPRILQFYTEPPLEMSREEALAHMQGWMVSADGETTCLVALVSEAGAADREAAVEYARIAAAQVAGLSADEIHMAGPTIEGVAIDNASKSGLLELNLISYGVCLTIMVLCLRSLRAALLVFLLALFNEQMSLALIHWWGAQLDSILLLTANLTFVLTIAIGIHLVNYYRDALATLSSTEAPVHALYVALKPTLVATATTALGLVSLSISEVRPLARFGLFSAGSIIVGATVVMVYTTIHFTIWPLRAKAAGSAGIDQSLATADRSHWFDWLQRMKMPVLVLVAILFVGGGLGVQKLRTAVGLREMVSMRTRSSQDFVWLEQRVGPLVPVELVLELPTGDARVMLDQFRLVNSLHHALEELSADNVVISTVTFSPEAPPTGGGFRQKVREAAFRQTLLHNQQELSNLGFLRLEDDSTFWRLSMRAPSMQDVNYGALLSQAQEAMDKTLADHPQIEPRSRLVCGGLPLVHRVQQQLLEDLIGSFLLAFSLVSLALMLLFRNVFCGLICMIPNVLPSAIVFGTMGWMGWSIEVGAILTASAALGIAVDDSLHFITWFQRKVKSGGTIPEAVRYAYRRCGAAMVQTSLICSLGLVVFTASDFLPIARFGWCMFALLLLALVADLVVLPAILLSPLGRPFLPRLSHEAAQLTADQGELTCAVNAEGDLSRV